MLGIAQSAVLASRLYLLRRRQFDSLPLRRLFEERYGIVVGLYSYGCFDRWRMRGPMRVGRYCSIASTVRTALDNHPTNALTTHPALYEKGFGVVDADYKWRGSLVIEDDVWIGHNAMILPGCDYVGRGAIVGAGAIVTKRVPSYTIVAGNPAIKLRDRFPADLIEAIEASRWWELSLSGLRTLLKTHEDVVLNPTHDSVSGWIRQRGRI